MKDIVIWLAGLMLCMPSVIALISDSLLAMLAGLLWAVLVYAAAKTAKGRIYWHKWNKANETLTNIFESYEKKKRA